MYQLTGAVVNGATVTFSITDGQIGDDDLTANGTIVIQGGPAAVAPSVIPTLGSALPCALALLLLGLGWAVQRRRGSLH